MKKLLSFLLIMSIAFSLLAPVAAMAEESNVEADGDLTSETPVQEEYVEYNLSLEDAIKMALTDNPQLIANEFSQNANKININSAKITRNATKKSLAAVPLAYSSATTIEQLCAKKGYYVTAAQVQYDLSVIEKERITASVSYNVTNAYYNVVLIDMLVNAAKNSLSMAIENKTIVDAQYEQGLVSKMSYDNAGISVDAARSKLEAYELNRNIAMKNLKNQLHLDDNCALYLTDSIATEDYSSDVDADVVSALETRYDLIAAKKMYELSAEYFDISESFTSGSAVYNTAYADMLNKEYQYNTALDGIELAIRSSYNSIISNRSAMNISERSVDMAQKEYEAAKLQYDLGLITNLQLTDAIYKLYEAEVNYSQAKLNYTMSVEKYKYDITIGLPQ